jgi:mannose-6-phosphate isomerase-like protein (cupin superfamily)
VANVNDYDVRVVKVRGSFVWHKHDDTDEFFLVIDGLLTIDLRDGPGGAERAVDLPSGSLFVVPRGIEHRPRADQQTSVMLFEPTGTVNTGDHEGPTPEHVSSTIGRRLE